MSMPLARADRIWLAELCVARIGYSMIFTAYAGVLPLLKQDWNITAGQAGLVQSAWHAGYLTSLFAAGFLSERYGATRTFLATGLLAAASSLAFALLADGFVSAVVLYGLTGLCSGGSYTPGLTLISERFDPLSRGRAMGWFLAASSLGYALALVLAGALTPWVGWRGAFVACACGPLIAAAVSFRALRHTRNIIHPRTGDAGGTSSLRAVLRNRPAMLCIWAYTFHSWELLGMWAWLPTFLAASAAGGEGLTAKAVGLGALLTAVTYVASMAGSISGGSLSDRYGRTAVILFMSLTSLFCSLTFGWMTGLPLWLLMMAAILYNVTAIGDSSIYSTAITELVPPRHLGAAYSIRSVLGFGSGVVSPWMFGLVLDWGRGAPLGSDYAAWGLAWMSLGAGAMLGPLMTWRLRQSPDARSMAHGRR